jgi:site-specific recombinase XerC
MQDLVPLGLYELVNNHPPPPLDTLLARPASVHTRRTYQHVALAYLAWLERDPFQVNRTIMENYRGEMLISCRPAAVALRLRIVGELYEEAIAAGLVAENPTQGVSPPNHKPDAACWPPPREVAAARLPNCNQSLEAGQRDHALYLLVVEKDVSPADVAALRVADLDERGVLHLRRNGGTGTELDLPPPVAEAINGYLANREVADDSPLFGPPRHRGRQPGCRVK